MTSNSIISQMRRVFLLHGWIVRRFGKVILKKMMNVWGHRHICPDLNIMQCVHVKKNYMVP
jgi:hypothetical protein